VNAVNTTLRTEMK